MKRSLVLFVALFPLVSFAMGEFRDQLARVKWDLKEILKREYREESSFSMNALETTHLFSGLPALRRALEKECDERPVACGYLAREYNLFVVSLLGAKGLLNLGQQNCTISRIQPSGKKVAQYLELHRLEDGNVDEIVRRVYGIAYGVPLPGNLTPLQQRLVILLGLSGHQWGYEGRRGPAARNTFDENPLSVLVPEFGTKVSTNIREAADMAKLIENPYQAAAIQFIITDRRWDNRPHDMVIRSLKLDLIHDEASAKAEVARVMASMLSGDQAVDALLTCIRQVLAHS